MDIVVKGRHVEVSERFRRHTTEKLGRIGKLDPKLIRLDVEVSEERNPRLSSFRDRVEITVRSRGPVIRAEAAADDKYAALDLALDKLEARLRRVADRRRVHRAGKAAAPIATASPVSSDRPAGSAGAAQSGETASAAGAGQEVAERDVETPGPFVVREKVHTAPPMTLDQALFEMELVGHDFYLFADKDSGLPSVVYRRKGYDYGVIRLDASAGNGLARPEGVEHAAADPR